jgi:hypothetical protein
MAGFSLSNERKTSRWFAKPGGQARMPVFSARQECLASCFFNFAVLLKTRIDAETEVFRSVYSA